MLTVRWILCIALLAVCAPAYSQLSQQAPGIEGKEQPQNPPPPNDNSQSDSNRIPPAPPMPPQPIPKIDTHESSEDTKDRSNEASEYWTVFGHILKITDSLLVVFTALLFAATIFLYWATKSLVIGAEETAKRQLRAHVAVSPTEFSDPNNFSIRFSMINYGQTPAYDVVETAVIDIFPYPLPPNFKFPELPIQQHSRIVLYPHATNITGIAYGAKSSDLKDSGIAGDGRIYIYGRVTYTDIFKDPHVTEFCHSIPKTMKLVEFLKGTPLAHIHVDSETANQHNEAD